MYPSDRSIIDSTAETKTVYVPFTSPLTPSTTPHPPAGKPRDPHAPPSPARRHFLSSFIHSCTPAELLYMSGTITPLLKCDFLSALPTEIALHVLGALVPDSRTLIRASAVSRSWRSIAQDEWIWRAMCREWGFLGPMQEEDDYEWADVRNEDLSGGNSDDDEPLEEMEVYADLPMDPALEWVTASRRRARGLGTVSHLDTKGAFSYRRHFKYSYMTMMNWRHGGRILRTHRLSRMASQPPNASSNADTNANSPPDNGVVTSLALDDQWVVVGLASSRIHVFSSRTGVLARTLVGHETGVWGVCLISRGGRHNSNQGGEDPTTGRSKNRRGDADVRHHDVDPENMRSTKKERRGRGKGRRAHSSGDVDRDSDSDSDAVERTTNSLAELSASSSYHKGKRAGKRREGNEFQQEQTQGGGSVWPGSGSGEPLDHLVPPSLRRALGLEPLYLHDGKDGPVGRRHHGREGGVGGRGVVDEDAEDAISRVSAEKRVPSPSGSLRPPFRLSHPLPKARRHTSLKSRLPSTSSHRYITSSDSSSRSYSSSRSPLPSPSPPPFSDRTPRSAYSSRASDPVFASEGWGQPNALVVSGGCDKAVRVWDIKSGHSIYTLHGHTSTIRCMRVLHGRPVAVTGSRDTTLRVWDVQRGRLLRVLRGHTASVRCLDVNGDRVVSGSYDTTCRLWNIDTGECIFVLSGHFHQVYSIAFDGIRIVSGGLDTTIRVWDAETGKCIALLQSHTALVCQLQLHSALNLLSSGGSDGRVITFSLSTFLPIHRIAAHDSSVTSLQFDERFLVTGGVDGRVKLFEVKTGMFIREMGNVGGSSGVGQGTGERVERECIWKVGYTASGEESWRMAKKRKEGWAGGGGTCVVVGRRSGKTFIDIWSFRPKEVA